MSNTKLLETKIQLDQLFCDKLNSAIINCDDNHNLDPRSLKHFYVNDNGANYCQLVNGDCLVVTYTVAPALVDGTIKVFVNVHSEEYGNHTLYILMDVDMLELYKDYITLYIDVAITNEHHRILNLSTQATNNNKH